MKLKGKGAGRVNGSDSGRRRSSSLGGKADFSKSPLRKVFIMILLHRNIGHKGFHIVDYEAKTYVISYDSMCLCGSKLLFGVDSSKDK